jgi:hypothetical protein
MLQLGSRMQTIEGVTVFPDHADEELWWYLPSHIALARRPEDDFAYFTFIKFKRAATAQGVEGGGFLMFGVELTLPEDVERAIRSKIPGSARLAAVPFDSGSVKCVALNLQGPGGTVAPVGVDGSFIAVEQILGASVPSLFGKNDAIFSLTLSAEGATLLEAAFAQGATPIGVIYDLTFTAMQPALDVKITADFERIYKHFSAGLNANVYYVEIGIEAGLEELVQSGAITIEVTNFSTAEDKADQEQWAIEFFKQQLLKDWFTPTLTPGTLQGGMATAPRAGGGAALFGKDKGATDGRQGGGSGSAAQRPGAQRPPEPGPPPPPRPPDPPAGGGQTPPARPPTGSGGTQSPPTPGGGTQQPPTPGGGQQPPPAPGTETRVVVNFCEDGSTRAVRGRFETTLSAANEERTTVTPQDAPPAALLTVVVPAAWRRTSYFIQAHSLPMLTAEDAGQLRSLFDGGLPNGVQASGQREAPLGAIVGELDVDPARPDSLGFTVLVPVTRSRITASSADALVNAVLPGGRLVQEGIHDVRRIAGTNDFELIGLGWPGSVRPNGTGGG